MPIMRLATGKMTTTHDNTRIKTEYIMLLVIVDTTAAPVLYIVGQ